MIKTRLTVTKLLQDWQVNDDNVLLQRWQINNNDKSNNIKSVCFEVSHVIYSHNLKSCDHNITQFYKDKFRFLSYLVSAQGVQIKDKRIDIVKNWPEPKFIHDI